MAARRSECIRAAAPLLTWLMSCHGQLAAASSVPDSLQACAQERDDGKRLACYDREVRRLSIKAQQSIGLSEHQERQLDPPEARTSAPPTPQAESASISSITHRSDGRSIFTLDNDQVWVQGEAFEAFDAKVGDAVIIKAGALGSFHMRSPSGEDTRVTRAR
jgi:hypothetical protein